MTKDVTTLGPQERENYIRDIRRRMQADPAEVSDDETRNAVRLIRLSRADAIKAKDSGGQKGPSAMPQRGETHTSKNNLIRALVKQRLCQNSMGSIMGLDESMVDSLDMVQLAGIPEGAIATIVETYAMLKEQGIPDHEIFARMEAHRSKIGTGEMPKPINLQSYTYYRIEIEHSHGAQISEDFVTEAVRVCRKHFNC